MNQTTISFSKEDFASLDAGCIFEYTHYSNIMVTGRYYVTSLVQTLLVLNVELETREACIGIYKYVEAATSSGEVIGPNTIQATFQTTIREPNARILFRP